MSRPKALACAVEPLTDNGGHSERCSNPLCRAEVKGKRGKKFCSDHCRMDGYVLRRAKEIMNRVGVVKFYTIVEGS